MKENELKLLLTAKEVVDYVGISRSTMYDFMAKGTFPKPVKLGARMARWRREDIINYCKNPERFNKE